MSQAQEKFRYIFRYVFTLMALVAFAALAVIVSFYIAQKADREAHERVTFFHQEALDLAARIRKESQSLLGLLGYDIPEITEVTRGDGRVFTYGPDSRGTLRMIEANLGELRELHGQHGIDEYAATLNRVDDRFKAVEYGILRGDPAMDSRRAILMFDLAIEQLYRQHSISAEKTRPDVDSMMARPTPYLSVFALILAATGIAMWVAVGLLRKSIARQVEMEEALAENVERMHHLEKLEALGRLVGGIAHDFNNLLTAVLGQAGLLQDRETDERKRKGLAEIQEAGRQAAALTKQLLNFGRPAAVEVRVVDLNDLIGNTESMLARIIGEDIELQIDYAEDLYPVELDPGQLQQVIVNLVVNARDAMPDGGQVSIATHNVHIGSSAANVTDVPAGRYVKVTVADTGVGMTEDIREHIFEPYFTTKEMGQGTGLGLATAYGIVNAARGHISVSSRAGAGTRFDILLPRSVETARSPDEVPAVSEDFTGDESVLVVEDEQQIREFLKHGLESLGYRVYLAADAVEGLESCGTDNDPIDVILADVILPGKNGVEFLVQALALQPHAKAILMSGYTDDVLERTGIDESDIPLVHKPFEIAEIARVIRERLAEDRGHRAAAMAS